MSKKEEVIKALNVVLGEVKKLDNYLRSLEARIKRLEVELGCQKK